jgi:hypothetical protein
VDKVALDAASLLDSPFPDGQPAPIPHPQSTYARRIAIDRQTRQVSMYLPIARGEVAPSRPGLDEPIKDAAARKEKCRRMAVKKLHEIYRDQLEIGLVDSRFRAFLAESMERIFSETNLVEAMQGFQGKARRGAPRRVAARNFRLAADVRELVNDGKTVDDACGEVEERLKADGPKLDSETLRNIYYQETKHKIDEAAIEAEIGFRRVTRTEK